MRLVSRYSLCAPSPYVNSVSTRAPYPCALRASALAVALLLAASHGHAESKFTDPEDGAFDLSNLLLTHRGVLPVPTLITEPAVGYGLGSVCSISRCRRKAPMRPTIPKRRRTSPAWAALRLARIAGARD
jgi:hypothetical protein